MHDLKTIRELKRLTQKDLAEVIGVNQSHIACIESGQMLPRQSTRQKIEGILGSEIDWVSTYASDRVHIGHALKQLINTEHPGVEERLRFCRQYLHALETLTQQI